MSSCLQCCGENGVSLFYLYSTIITLPPQHSPRNLKLRANVAQTHVQSVNADFQAFTHIRGVYLFFI